MQTRPVGSEVLSLLEANYVDPEGLKRWIGAGGAERLLNAGFVGNRAEGDAAINAALDKLGVSHTRRFTSDQIDYYHLADAYSSAGIARRLKALFPRGVRYAGIGILANRSVQGFFATAVLPGSPAARAGIVVGDELIAVNDAGYSPVRSFVGLEGRAAVVQVRSGAGHPPRAVPVLVASVRPRWALKKASVDGARVLPGARRRIGYYRAWSLAGDEQWRALVDTVSGRLRDCDALVLDLRIAVGGASPDHAEFFVGRSPELELRAGGREPLLVNPRWRKPVVVIADATTRSGNEVLAFTLQRAGAPVVGQRTAGEVAASRPFVLSDGSLLLVAAYRVTADGVALERKGVVPDVAVDAPGEYAGGVDPQFDAAIALADRC